jgi:hypothetical protein
MTFRLISERRSRLTRMHWLPGKTSHRSHGMSGSAGPSLSRKRRHGGSMSKGCAQNSRKGCADRAAGRAVRIDEHMPARFHFLCRRDRALQGVHGAEYLNILKAISGQRFQIGNNRGGINGWIGANGIFGRLKTLRYFVFTARLA